MREIGAEALQILLYPIRHPGTAAEAPGNATPASRRRSADRRHRPAHARSAPSARPAPATPGVAPDQAR
ncbi:hypothetical protein G6F51_014678 [Rhizopus arrhizus]|uniref:Uncharacterized protein n=1 Tax=Rhizopus oryzae TaxID=64495 RepID=A0A9P6XLP1_RHIOR|nr:hypothetical protein G6F51_014678 [Rhizopus arrhizus]